MTDEQMLKNVETSNSIASPDSRSHMLTNVDIENTLSRARNLSKPVIGMLVIAPTRSLTAQGQNLIKPQIRNASGRTISLEIMETYHA